MRCPKCKVTSEFDKEEDEFWCNLCGWTLYVGENQKILNFN
jgi:ribosomal protein L37AE/L43A